MDDLEKRITEALKVLWLAVNDSQNRERMRDIIRRERADAIEGAAERFCDEVDSLKGDTILHWLHGLARQERGQ